MGATTNTPAAAPPNMSHVNAHDAAFAANRQQLNQIWNKACKTHDMTDWVWNQTTTDGAKCDFTQAIEMVLNDFFDFGCTIQADVVLELLEAFCLTVKSMKPASEEIKQAHFDFFSDMNNKFMQRLRTHWAGVVIHPYDKFMEAHENKILAPKVWCQIVGSVDDREKAQKGYSLLCEYFFEDKELICLVKMLQHFLRLSNSIPNKAKRLDRHAEAEEWCSVLLWNLNRRVTPGHMLLKVIKEEPGSIISWDKGTSHYSSSVGKQLVMVVEEIKRMVDVMKVDNSDDLKYAQDQLPKLQDALDHDVEIKTLQKKKWGDEESDEDFGPSELEDAAEADEETRQEARGDDRNYRKTEKKDEDKRLMEVQIAAKEMTREEREKEAQKLEDENLVDERSVKEFESTIEPLAAGRGEQKLPSHLLLSGLVQKQPRMKIASATALQNTGTFDFVNAEGKLTEDEIKKHEVDCDLKMMTTYLLQRAEAAKSNHEQVLQLHADQKQEIDWLEKIQKYELQKWMRRREMLSKLQAEHDRTTKERDALKASSQAAAAACEKIEKVKRQRMR